MENLEIIKATINERDTKIQFIYNKNITVGTKLIINLNDKGHYFNVDEVTATTDEYLFVTASEVGYWCNYFTNDNNFNIKDIIGLYVSIISDEEKIKKINKESNYC